MNDPRQSESPAAVRRVVLTPGFAAVVLTVLAAFVLARTVSLVLLAFVAILLAVYLDACTDALERATRWRRPVAFAAVLVGTFLLAWGVEALLVPPVIAQTHALVVALPRYAATWQDRLGDLTVRFPALEPFIGDRKQDVIDGAMSQAEALVGDIVPQVFNLVHLFILIVSAFVMAVYFARTPRTYVDLVVAVVPPRHRETARGLLHALGATLRSWVFAQLFNMVLLGALTALGLWALGVPSWLAFGIFAGIAAIVPFFGTLASTIIPALFVVDRGVTPVVLVLLLGVVVHVIEGNIVSPLVFQRGVHLPPVLTILAVLAMGALFGPVGLLVAVPTLAVLMTVVRTLLIEGVYGDPPHAAARARDARE